MNAPIISAQLYNDTNNDKTTPLLDSSNGSSPRRLILTHRLVYIFCGYKWCSLALGWFFGFCLYFGASLITGRFMEVRDVKFVHALPLFVLIAMWATAVVLATILLLLLIRTLMKLSKRLGSNFNSADAAVVVDQHQTTLNACWQSMNIVLVCCFVIGFECGAGAAWIGFLSWRQPVKYNVVFALLFFVICIFTGWALRVENQKLEAHFNTNKEQQLNDDDDHDDDNKEESSTTRKYESLMVV